MKTTKERRDEWRQTTGVGRCAVESYVAAMLIDDIDEAERHVSDLSMLIRRIAGYRGATLTMSDHGNVTCNRLIQDAVDYLIRHDLQGSPLRGAHDPYEPVSRESRDWYVSHCGVCQSEGGSPCGLTLSGGVCRVHGKVDGAPEGVQGSCGATLPGNKKGPGWDYFCDLPTGHKNVHRSGGPRRELDPPNPHVGQDAIVFLKERCKDSLVPKCVDELISAAIRIDKNVELLDLIDAVVGHYDEAHP